MKLVHLLLLIAVVSCSSKGPRVLKREIASDGTEIIELENPFQEKIDQELNSTRKLNAHTVYDSDEGIESYKEQKASKIIDKLSGPYHFYHVNKKEALSSIAMKIYGDPSKTELLHMWNDDVLPAGDMVSKGMVIKYLPAPKRSIASAKPLPTTPTFKTYTVKERDNLGFIALQLLGKREDWKKLQAWNMELLSDPNNLKAGMKLKYISSTRTPSAEK